MLKSREVLEGFLELVSDSDVHVVKRTIRVFTNVYKHSLLLLAEGKLDAELYASRYRHLSDIVDLIAEMLLTSDNEGVTLHLVRCLEVVIMTNITCNVARYPAIAQLIAPVFKKIYDALMAFVSTPYVGGTTFCIAMRALFMVAVHRDNLRPVIIQFSEGILESPPPNLFDHNIRSFRKSLQRNFFWLLKVAVEDDDKENLISLMGKVGIPRRRLTYWAPKIVSKKRAAQSILEDSIIFGNHFTTSKKKSRFMPKELVKVPEIPDDNMSTLVAKYKYSRSKVPNSATAMLDKILAMGEILTDPVTSNSNEQVDNLNISSSIDSKLVAKDSSMTKSKIRSECEVPLVKNSISLQSSDILNKIPEIPLDKISCTTSEIEYPLSIFSNRCSPKEQYLYDKLDKDMVVDIILNNADNVPSGKPDTMPVISMYDNEVMRENLSILFSLYLKEHDIVDNCLVRTNIEKCEQMQSSLESASQSSMSCSIEDMRMNQETFYSTSDAVSKPLNQGIIPKKNSSDIQSFYRDPRRQKYEKSISPSNRINDSSHCNKNNPNEMQSKVGVDYNLNSSNSCSLTYGRRTDVFVEETGFQSNSRNDRSRDAPNLHFLDPTRNPRGEVYGKSPVSSSSNRVFMPIHVPQIIKSRNRANTAAFPYVNPGVSGKFSSQHANNFFTDTTQNNMSYGGFV